MWLGSNFGVTHAPYHMGPNQGGKGGGQAGGKDGTGKGGSSGGKGGKSAGAFSDAGYANKSETGYKAGNQPGGGAKKVGNATVADHMIAMGSIDVPSIGPGGMAQGNYASQDDAYTDFATAIGDYETRGLLGKLADFFGGSWFDQQAPISQNPRTFAGGTYHTSTNPAGVAAGLAAPYGSGIFAGPLAASAYNALGGKNVFHGGYSQPDTGEYSDPAGGWGQTSVGGLLGGGGASSQQDNRGAQGGLLNPTTQPGVTPQAPVMPAAQPDAQQAQERKRRMYALGMNGVPGPTPYRYQTATWL